MTALPPGAASRPALPTPRPAARPPRMRARLLRTRVTSVVAGAAAVTGLAVAASAPPAGASSASALIGAPVGATTVVPGVRYWHSRFTLSNGDRERAVFMTVDLTDHHLHLNAVSARGLVNSTYQDIPAMAAATGAVAGINADFFDLGSLTGVTEGGIVRSGQVLKSPRPDASGNVYVRPNGTVGIGPVTWRAALTVGSGRSAVHAAVTSVNTIATAWAGGITEITPSMAGTLVGDRCTIARVALGRTVRAGRTLPVAGLHHEFRLHQLPQGALAFVGCGAGGRWLTAHLRRGTTAVLSGGLSTGPLTTLVSGGAVLVRDGRRWSDPHHHPVSGHNAETFVCTDQPGTHLLFGVIDQSFWGGWQGRGSAGVTYGELTDLMLRDHCWSGVVMDGGGSTTMVARPAGRSAPSVLNTPADGAPRLVPDGLFVYRS